MNRAKIKARLTTEFFFDEYKKMMAD
jgi:hypothetical protein